MTEGELTADLAPKRKKKPCARCGNFAKRAKLGDRRLCRECLDRLDPAQRGPITVGSLIGGGASLAWRAAGPLLPIYLLFALATTIADVQLGGDPDDLTAPVVGGVIGFFAGLLNLSMVPRASAAILAEEPLPSTGDLLSSALSRLGPLFGLQLRMSVVIGLYSLLLFVPGMLRAMDYAIAGPIFVLEGDRAQVAMDTSTARMQGWRWTLFFASLMTVVPVVAVGILGGMLRSQPIAQAMVGFTSQLILHFVAFVPAALYFKLRWREARQQLSTATPVE